MRKQDQKLKRIDFFQDMIIYRKIWGSDIDMYRPKFNKKPNENRPIKKSNVKS